MKRPLVLPLIMILTITSLYVAPATIRPAHAGGQSELVCIVSASTGTCPNSAPVILGSPPTSNILVSILINSSLAINSFDITLLSGNLSILKPAGVIKGTLLTGTHDVVKCVGGVNQLGAGSCPTTDTAATIQYAVAGDITSAPATGLLFQANFTIMGNSANTPITYQTGCTGTSLQPNTCVTILSGSTVPTPVTAQTAKFSNLNYFDYTLSTRAITTVSKGDPPDLNETITVSSVKSFTGTVSFTTEINGSATNPNVIFTLSPTSVSIAPLLDQQSTLNVTVLKNATPGTYILNITGTSPGLPANSITLLLIVPTPDFTISLSPTSESFNITYTPTVNVTISSVGNFNSTVTLSLTFPPTITASFNSSLSKPRLTQTLELFPKSTNMTRVKLGASVWGSYSLNVTGTSGSEHHFAILRSNVVDYQMTAPTTPMTLLLGTTQSETIGLSTTSLYNTTAIISNIYVEAVSGGVSAGPSPGLTVGCSPKSLILFTNGTYKTGFNSTQCAVTGNTVGAYTVTITATSGIGNRTSLHAVSFSVNVVSPGFNINLPTNVATVPVGSSTSLIANVTGTYGLVDNITIFQPTFAPKPGVSSPPTAQTNITATCPGTTPTPYCVRFTTTKTEAGIFITITAGTSTPPGYYNMTVHVGGHVSNPTNVYVSMLIIVVATTSPHNLGVMNVAPSTTTATIGDKINITIEVVNLGTVKENATVIAIVGDLTVGTADVTNLQPSHNTNETITWNTAGFNPGSYIIGGKVLAAPGQNNVTYSLIRYATPITLNTTSSTQFPYALVIAIAAIVVVAAGIGLFLLQRRKPTTTA